MATRKVPIIRKHVTGQAFIELKKKYHYLSVWGTPAAKAEFDRIMFLYLVHGRQPPERRPRQVANHSIDEALWRYLLHVENRTIKHQRALIAQPALKILHSIYGHKEESELCELMLDVVSLELQRRGCASGQVETIMNAARDFFEWHKKRQPKQAGSVER